MSVLLITLEKFKNTDEATKKSISLKGAVISSPTKEELASIIKKIDAKTTIILKQKNHVQK